MLLMYVICHPIFEGVLENKYNYVSIDGLFDSQQPDTILSKFFILKMHLYLAAINVITV